MDNQDFEQQFTQNVRSSVIKPVVAEESGPSKLPIIIAVALTLIVVVESIALFATIGNYSTAAKEYLAYEEITPELDNGTESNYSYDDEYNLTAMEITCTNENGAKISLDKSNKLEIFDANSTSTTSGNYTIIKDSIISLTGSNNDRTFYYDGFILADGTVIYDCEGRVDEVSTE